MTTLDGIAPNYVRARNRWPEARSLAAHYELLVKDYVGDSYGLVETVKSFVESVCITILGEFGTPMPSAHPTTTQLLVETLSVLGLEHSRRSSKLGTVLSAHNKLADALTAMRNENGPIAHGKDGFLDPLSSNHTRAFLLVGDTILCLLLSALEGKEPNLEYTREPYERFRHFHQAIDSSIMAQCLVEDEEDESVIVLTMRSAGLPDGLELRVEPSRLLYSIDRTAYIEFLAATDADTIASAKLVTESQVKAADAPAVRRVIPRAEIVPSYDGILSSLRDELQVYLDSLSLTTSVTAIDNAQLVDSLLATAERSVGIDWSDRATLQSRMKVALRRVLIQFDVEHDKTEEYAQHLVKWFKIKAIGVADSQSSVGDDQ